MPNYEWRFGESWPDLCSLTDKPLPNALAVNQNGVLLATSWLAPDGLSYLMRLPEDIVDQLQKGLLFAIPIYYQHDPGEEPRGKILLLAIDFVATLH